MSSLTQAEVAEIARLEADVDGWERAAHLHRTASDEARSQAGQAICRRVNLSLPGSKSYGWKWSPRSLSAVHDIGYRLELVVYRLPFSGGSEWIASVFDAQGSARTTLISSPLSASPEPAVRALLDAEPARGHVKRGREAVSAVERFLADVDTRRAGKVVA